MRGTFLDDEVCRHSQGNPFKKCESHEENTNLCVPTGDDDNLSNTARFLLRDHCFTSTTAQWVVSAVSLAGRMHANCLSRVVSAVPPSTRCRYEGLDFLRSWGLHLAREHASQMSLANLDSKQHLPEATLLVRILRQRMGPAQSDAPHVIRPFGGERDQRRDE